MFSRRASLLAFLAVSACGFVPAYGPDGSAAQWQNTVTIDAPDTVLGFRMRARLVEALGAATASTYQLKIAPEVDPVPATITAEGDITRLNLTGRATWAVTDASGVPLQNGLVQTFTSYSSTGSTVATQAAESDARDRLAIALADLIVQQLLTAP